MEKTKNNVGRPVTKIGRKKIGLSISGEANDTLEYLSQLSGKTKSRIFEEAISIMKKREEIIYARMENYVKEQDKALLDFDELMKNREAYQKTLEVSH